jgi:predicted MPP superfamily phosphohydrolase
MRRLRLPEHDLALPHWPTRLDGLRVAVISDLHAGGPNVRESHLEQLVRDVGGVAPDLVALLGDYVDPGVLGGRRVDASVVARHLARLRPPAVAILGNHDWHHEGSGVGDALRHAGIPVLENGHQTLELRGGPLHVAGVADSRHRDPRVGSALAGVPAGEPILLLSHDPDLFPYVPARVSLTLAGHLHGGQIDVPGLRGLVMPTRHGGRYKEGHVVEAGRHLFISRGVGETGVPIRLGAPPEVPILRLQAEETAAKPGRT